MTQASPVAALSVLTIAILSCRQRSPSNEAVARALEDPDACAARALTLADRNDASEEQRRLLLIREGECSRRAAVNKCEVVAERLANNQLTAEDKITLGSEGAALAERIQSARLVADDLALTPDKLPCGVRAFRSFASAARRSVSAWEHVENVSEQLLDDIGHGGGGLPEASETALKTRLREVMGNKGIDSMAVGELAVAVKVCLVAKAVHAAVPPTCQSAEKRSDALGRRNAEAQGESERASNDRELDRCRAACFTRTVRELEREGRNSNDVGGGVIGANCQIECRQKLGLPVVP